MSAMTQTVLLAIDTSTEFCSVALLVAAAAADDAPSIRTWVRHERTGAVSSTRVLPAVREVLDEAGRAFDDCDAIAFGAGPGSFTGLRTATGVVQGLAFGRGLPVVPVGTLVACAEAARLNAGDAAGRVTRVLAALDARMDEVYWADYAWDDAAGEWREIAPASLAAPADVRVPDAPFVLAGNAAHAFGDRLPACARAQAIDPDALPHALPIAHVALRAYRAGRVVPADRAAPEYVRDKVAQTTAERLAARADGGGR
ncbi:tRNA threonylcarbamoyladenosine biosynthesis protein TsaB [Burkholderia mayonis]|uniref:tRNA threonylcarbamoyladenosine biosynthesis protein TsaB n=1 Tax=Burkholderia mayonis TaxID=1385591 RepID=A0A1B4G0Z0_9BURK|nr:tRNA threonylcarbamoyladenosine biosynthesis protein TsaB [Burkholderia mayonis]KVE52185.1 tRNA threonylcarbamoyladenosine biosynthesis protein TsaB [Burkholderia mayonis]